VIAAKGEDYFRIFGNRVGGQFDVTNVTLNNSDKSTPTQNLLERGKYFPYENSDDSTPTQNLEAIIAERVEQELYLIILSNRVGGPVQQTTQAFLGRRPAAELAKRGRLSSIGGAPVSFVFFYIFCCFLILNGQV
jgi:hypothetical protein